MAARFPGALLQMLADARAIGIRAGDEHRHLAVWVVVVEGRVFVRSWNDAPAGWYRAFLAERNGSLKLGDREIEVTGRPARSARLRQAVSRAYAEKYDTKGSQKWVRGFAEPQREANTLELLPRVPRRHKARRNPR